MRLDPGFRAATAGSVEDLVSQVMERMADVVAQHSAADAARPRKWRHSAKRDPALASTIGASMTSGGTGKNELSAKAMHARAQPA